jgi:hypothetical protein
LDSQTIDFQSKSVTVQMIENIDIEVCADEVEDRSKSFLIEITYQVIQ